MSSKLISIVGPTSVGKTSFVLKLVANLNENSQHRYDGFNIISADSRQVYKDLMIVSGADVPSTFTRENNYFKKDNLRLYGLLDLDYTDEWSLAHFKEFAQDLIKQSWAENRLPIIVGGTGLYHAYLFNDSPTIGISPNDQLRKELELLSLDDLQKRLQDVKEDRFERMNNSDRNNPVRLIRAIEVELFYLENLDYQPQLNKTGTKEDFDYLVVGLTDELDNIESKIKQRALNRFDNGALIEIEGVAAKVKEYGVNKKITTATGVKEIMSYLDGTVEKTECLDKWSLREYQYAKRQLTWWRQNKDIHWYEISQDGWMKKAFEKVNKFILPE